MKGNEAIAEAAIRAGCTGYFGYPITPQNELTAYMSRHMPAHGRTFIQAESEVAAINMVYGAAATGARAMTSSSSPGVSLKQEGISYAAGADLPCVIANISRSGPGLGGISPAQGDYYQSTRGGGHGDYRTIVLAPKDVQEAADLTYQAFDLADEWRMPVLLLADGLIGQMMEGVVLPPVRDLSTLPAKPWAVGHRLPGSRGNNHVTSMNLVPEELEVKNNERWAHYSRVAQAVTSFRETNTDAADLVFVAYGSSSRICYGAILAAKAMGIELGLYRPLSLWPYPDAGLARLAAAGKRFLCVEMSMGQMVEDVRLAVSGRAPVDFYGRTGGVIPSEEEVLAEALRILGQRSGSSHQGA
jgi:2-oxoglutarate ferredoxin oxidoreductase subunit alpha